MDEKYLAHSANDSGHVHLLSAHLEGVALLAAQYADVFGGSEEAQAAGLLHDLGKFRRDFQSYLRKERDGGIDTHHAPYGAAVAFNNGWPCAFAIAGHHTGLHDRHKLQGLVEDDGPYRIAKRLPSLVELFGRTVGKIPGTVGFPGFLMDENPWDYEFYIRMLFSCLVDADYLDTEAHFAGEGRKITRLADVCPELIDRIMKERASKSREGIVNEIRHAIFDQCAAKARQTPGFFSLTVPTGGGKTLASMAFALEHAKRWNLGRVIVVIPYLSIIEQNAAEYHRILDPQNRGLVVEHHSAVAVPEDRDLPTSSLLERATENWDAPIIVTTSVQFIETLFASSPSKCRKLHNVARSVVILDEVQTLPFHLLNPVLNVLKELKENYGVSFVFMTATQPAFRRNASWLSEGFNRGEVAEITQDSSHVFNVLKRVDYKLEGIVNWNTIARRMADFPQVLSVVNVRKHAFELWEVLRDLLPKEEHESVFHLSSAMCPEHRSFILGEIKDPREGSIRHRLQSGLPCRLVATQLVEAGVDLDFPLVFRAMGPLDSIVQAAGRCNREGRLVDSNDQPRRGKVIVFTPEDHALPRGVYNTATNHTIGFLQRASIDIFDTEPGVFADYFSQLFQLTDTDYARHGKASIQEDRRELHFREVSGKAKVIEDTGRPVVVPYGKGKEVIKEIHASQAGCGSGRFSYRDLRRLQRFMVNVRWRDFQRLYDLGMIGPILPSIDLLVLNEGCYNDSLGLLIESRPVEDLVQ